MNDTKNKDEVVVKIVKKGKQKMKNIYRLQKINFHDLKKGDKFIVAERGKLVKGCKGNSEAIVFRAISNPIRHQAPIYGEIQMDEAKI